LNIENSQLVQSLKDTTANVDEKLQQIPKQSFIAVLVQVR
jgi:hypothetical protein